MTHAAGREMTVEEFDEWCDASDRVDAVAKAADEEGGPRLSLVPLDEREIAWPTDLLPPAGARRTAEQCAGREAARTAGRRVGDADPDRRQGTMVPCRPGPDSDAGDSVGGEDSAAIAPEPFDGIVLEDSRKRMTGWSAERQRLFLDNLAETGSVHLASSAARLTARSAYRLRVRSPAFASAWDVAEQLAVGRLSALAFDRAIHGRTEQVWHSGDLVAERRVPSDKMLMWLLARLDPRRFAAPWELRKDDAADPQAEARQAFPALLDTLTDTEA